MPAAPQTSGSPCLHTGQGVEAEGGQRSCFCNSHSPLAVSNLPLLLTQQTNLAKVAKAALVPPLGLAGAVAWRQVEEQQRRAMRHRWGVDCNAGQQPCNQVRRNVAAAARCGSSQRALPALTTSKVGVEIRCHIVCTGHFHAPVKYRMRPSRYTAPATEADTGYLYCTEWGAVQLGSSGRAKLRGKPAGALGAEGSDAVECGLLAIPASTYPGGQQQGIKSGQVLQGAAEGGGNRGAARLQPGVAGVIDAEVNGRLHKWHALGCVLHMAS